MLDWQIVFCIWLILSTAASLLYRKVAVTSQLNPLVSGTIRNVTVGIPATIVLAVVSGQFQMPSMCVLLISLFEAILGVSYGYASFYAIKETDTSTFTTLVKTSVIPLIALSSIFLGEGLSVQQLVGSALILLSAMMLGKIKLSRKGIAWMTLSIALITLIPLLARYLVESVGLVTTMVLSITYSFLLKLPFSAKALVKERKQIRKELPLLFMLSIVAFPQVLLLIWATDLADNLSLLSSLAAGKVVTVSIAAAIFLKERDHLKIKISAAIVAAAGAVLL